MHALKVRPCAHGEAAAYPAFMRSCAFPSNLFGKAVIESRLSCAPISHARRSAAEGTVENTGGRKRNEILPLNRKKKLGKDEA